VWREGQITEVWTRSVLVIILKKGDMTVQQLQNNSAAQSYVQSSNDGLVGETQSTGGTLSCGRTSRIQKRPQHDTTNSDALINSRESTLESHTNVQLLCGLPESI
jgi:hypothetical protein